MIIIFTLIFTKTLQTDWTEWTQHFTHILHMSKKLHFCFCQNFVKFPPSLISFGRWMAKWLKLYAV